LGVEDKKRMYVLGAYGWRIITGRKIGKLGQKTGSEKVFSGTPGRGVLRFWEGVYRKPRSDLAIFGHFFRKVSDLGVDVI